MPTDPPERLTEQELQRLFTDGPAVTSKVSLVVVKGRMYRRDGKGWQLVEDAPRQPRTA